MLCSNINNTVCRRVVFFCCVRWCSATRQQTTVYFDLLWIVSKNKGKIALIDRYKLIVHANCNDNLFLWVFKNSIGPLFSGCLVEWMLPKTNDIFETVQQTVKRFKKFSNKKNQLKIFFAIVSTLMPTLVVLF